MKGKKKWNRFLLCFLGILCLGSLATESVKPANAQTPPSPTDDENIGLQGHFNVKRKTGIDGSVPSCRICHDFENGSYSGGDGKNLRWIRNEIVFKGEKHTVKYTVRSVPFGQPADGTMADGNDALLDGPCEVCHTQTRHHKNTGDGHIHNDGLQCTMCHLHFGEGLQNYFRPGGGDSWPHMVHRQMDRGPRLDFEPKGACINCHGEFGVGPLFWRDGAPSLEQTTVCNPCHSPGGAYDGVNDPLVGAKNNWRNNITKGSIYEVGGARLLPTKQKWCVGCHDGDPEDTNNLPSNSRPNGSGVFAPSIAGDGTVYGYWLSGHGSRKTNEEPNGQPCSICHALQSRHLDHVARTYEADETKNPSVAITDYRDSYRLDKSHYIEVPRNTGSVAQFELCLRCHSKLLTEESNFRSDVSRINQTLLHSTHLEYGYPQTPWDSDDDGLPTRPQVLGGDSAMSCPTCHNPHGTRMFFDNGSYAANRVMIRDGSLDSSPRGLSFMWYDLPDGRGGGGNQVSDRSLSLSGQLIPRGPSCQYTCHPGNPIYNRDPAGWPAVVVDRVWTSDVQGNLKTEFRKGETVRIHVDLTVRGGKTYIIKTMKETSTIRQGSRWVRQLPVKSATLGAGSYMDQWSWDVILNHPATVKGNANITVTAGMFVETPKGQVKIASDSNDLAKIQIVAP